MLHMKKYINYIVAFVVVALLAIFYYFIVTENEKMKVAKAKQSEGTEIAGKIVEDILCEIDEENNMKLSELVKDRPKLIFRFSNTHCSSCYERQIDKINEIFKHSDDIVILCSYTNRGFILFKSRNRTKVPVYRIPEEEIKWDVNKPFYFLLNKDMSVSNVYIPNINSQQEQQKTTQYLIKMRNVINAE